MFVKPVKFGYCLSDPFWVTRGIYVHHHYPDTSIARQPYPTNTLHPPRRTTYRPSFPTQTFLLLSLPTFPLRHTGR